MCEACEPTNSARRPFTGLLADERLRHRREALVLVFAGNRDVHAAPRVGVVVDRDEAVEPALGVLRQRVVGGAQRGELGRAAVGRQHARMQQRRLGRHALERAVGMPVALADAELHARIVGRHQLAVRDRGWRSPRPACWCGCWRHAHASSPASPKRRLKAICASSSRSCSGKTSTEWLSNASSITEKSRSLKGSCQVDARDLRAEDRRDPPHRYRHRFLAHACRFVTAIVPQTRRARPIGEGCIGQR